MKNILTFLFIYSMSSIYLFCQDEIFVNYTDDNYINKMAEEGDYLWIATRGGLVRFNKTTEEIKYYNPFNSGLKDYDLTALTLDEDGNKIIGSDNLYIFDGQNWKVFDRNKYYRYFTSKGTIATVSRHKKGDIHFSGEDYMFKCDGENLSYVDSTEIPFWNPCFHVAYSIKWDRDDRLWIGGMHGAGYYDGNVWQLLVLFDTPGTYIAYSILFGDNEKIFIGTNLGLAIFDGTEWTYYSKSRSNAPFSTIYDIAKDESGNLWMASILGLVKYDGNNFRVFDTSNSDIISKKVNTVLVDKDNIVWAGTDKGICKYDGNSIKNFNLNFFSFITGFIDKIFIDKIGRVSFCTGTGLVNYKDGHWGYHRYSEIGEGIKYTCSEIDEQGNIWIGTEKNGLLKFNGNNWEIFDSLNSGLPRNSIIALDMGKPGDLWIGTNRYELVRFDGNYWEVFDTTNSNLPLIYFSNICVDKNNVVWIKKNDELYSYYNDVLTKQPHVDSLIDLSYSFRMKDDKQGNMWFSGNKGLLRYDGSNWDLIENPYKKGGFGAIYFDKKDDLWGGSANILFHLENNMWDSTEFGVIPDRDLPIRNIAIDSFDNKWISTTAGLIVYREGGVILKVDEDIFQYSNTPYIFPNPVISEASIKYNIAKSGNVTIDIYNSIGQMIATVLNEYQSEGNHNFKFHLINDQLSYGLGIYFIRITTDDQVMTGKFVKVE